MAKSVLPPEVVRRVRSRKAWPPRKLIHFGMLRRLTPIGGSNFGVERGTPVDRYYIDDFLGHHASQANYLRGHIRGCVLEVGGDRYSRRYGNGAVTSIDVLNVDPDIPGTTIVGDLTGAEHIPSDFFDCIICTQTLLLIYDVRAAIRTLERILRPGGVLLVTVPGISPLCRPEADVWGDFWRFTSLSARRLFEEAFPPQNVSVETYGNVLSSVAFLHGLAAEDLRQSELDVRDPRFQLVIAITARKNF